MGIRASSSTVGEIGSNSTHGSIHEGRVANCGLHFGCGMKELQPQRQRYEPWAQSIQPHRYGY